LKEGVIIIVLGDIGDLRKAREQASSTTSIFATK